MTSLITLPNRPLGTDIPSIEQVLADFDTITNPLNQEVIEQPRLILSAGGTFDTNNVPLGGATFYALPSGGYGGGDTNSGQAITLNTAPFWVGDFNSPQDFQLPGVGAKIKMRGVITVNGASPGSGFISQLLFVALLVSNQGFNNIRYVQSTTVLVQSLNISPAVNGVYTFESAEGTIPTDPTNYRHFDFLFRVGPGFNAGCRITCSAQAYAYNS